MGFMQKVEQKIEFIVGDTLAFVFGGKVQLQEVSFALRRQAREGTVRLANGSYRTPSRYTVYISPEDRSGILEKSNVSLQLAADLEHFIADNAWSLAEPVVIFIQANGALRSGQFRVQGGAVSTQNSPAANSKSSSAAKSAQVSPKLAVQAEIVDDEYPHSQNGQYIANTVADSPEEHVEVIPENSLAAPIETEVSYRDSLLVSAANGSTQHRSFGTVKQETSYPAVQHGVRLNGEYINTVEPDGDFPAIDLIQAVELIDNSDPTQIYELSPGTTILGRGQEADLRILDSGISRKHAQIIYDEEFIEIADLGSTNGTSVNHTTIQKQVLQDADLISLGHSEFVIRIFFED